MHTIFERILGSRLENMLYFFIETNMENQINVGSQNTRQNKKNQETPQPNRFTITTVGASALIVVIVAIFSSFLTWKFLTSGYQLDEKRQEDQINLLKSQISNLESQLQVKSSDLNIDDVSKWPVVTKTEIDTSTWPKYLNKELGFSLRYPPEWGQPQGNLNSCQDKENCSTDGEESYSFFLTFSNKGRYEVGVSGLSKNFSTQRDPALSDFSSFDDSLLGDYCRTGSYLKCQKTGNVVDYLSSVTPILGCMRSGGIRAIMVNIQNRPVSGLFFGGFFIPRGSIIQKLINKYRCDPRATEILNNALLERRLDRQTMKSYDELEEMLSTVRLD